MPFDPSTFMLRGSNPNGLTNDNTTQIFGASSNDRLNQFKQAGNTWDPSKFHLVGNTSKQNAAAQKDSDQANSKLGMTENFIGAIPGSTGKVLGGIANSLFVKPAKSLASVPETLASGGSKTIPGSYQSDAVSDVMGGMNPAEASLKEGSKATLDVATLGDVADNAPELATKFSNKVDELAPKVISTAVDAAEKASDLASHYGGKIGDALSKAATMAKDGALGKDAVKTLEMLNNPEVKAFLPESEGGSGKTLDEVAQKTSDAVSKFVTESKSALKAVKDAIPDVPIKASEIATRVNQGIMNSVESNAAYKGISKDASMFKDPQDLVNSGLLDDGEVKKVNGMTKVIENWTDNSARGVLNLKEKLGSFYKEGADNSNSILRNIQGGLKDLVGEVYPDIKPALKTASDNIDKAEEFARNLVGNSSIQGESKIKSIIANIQNPAAGAGKMGLLSDLKSLTGYDAVPELKGYKDYLDLVGKDFDKAPAKFGTVSKAVAKRLGIAGGVTAALAGLRDLLHL